MHRAAVEAGQGELLATAHHQEAMLPFVGTLYVAKEDRVCCVHQALPNRLQVPAYLRPTARIIQVHQPPGCLVAPDTAPFAYLPGVASRMSTSATRKSDILLSPRIW